MRDAPSSPPDSSFRPDGEAPSRRLTPSMGLAAAREDDARAQVNEDFLFHLYRGSELLQDNRAHEAKEELERALRLQPHDTKGQDLLAVVYFRLGHYPRAIAIYEQLRRESPRDPALLLNLALCYLKTGQASLARRDLELLLEINPRHSRGWGYLGLACERLGALVDAQRAFEQGGHGQMARRMIARRNSQAPPPSSTEDRTPSQEARDVVATAFEELDAGELSFELAKPASDSRESSPDSWSPIELGTMRRRLDAAPISVSFTDGRAATDSKSPSTKDGPPPAPEVARDLPPPSSKRGRPTLLGNVAPPRDAFELEALSRVPSPRPPSFGVEPPLHSASLPVVRVPGASHLDRPLFDPSTPPSTRTLPPPSVQSLPAVARPATAPPAAEDLAEASVVAFPPAGSVVVHPSGVALVHPHPLTGFATRLEAVRVASNALSMRVLERQTKGAPSGEPFGGVGSPLVHVGGEGKLVVGPRSGRRLASFGLHDDMCFVREEILLGFDGALAFENGRLTTGDRDFVSVVQLKGTGAVLVEAIGEILTLTVEANHGFSVRREVILGWFGRLVPRAIGPGEAPGGQRGLVSFAGVGRVLVASA